MFFLSKNQKVNLMHLFFKSYSIVFNFITSFHVKNKPNKKRGERTFASLALSHFILIQSFSLFFFRSFPIPCYLWHPFLVFVWFLISVSMIPSIFVITSLTCSLLAFFPNLVDSYFYFLHSFYLLISLPHSRCIGFSHFCNDLST